MKKYFIYTILFAFVASISFTGCKYDDECDCSDNGAVAYNTLTAHLKSIDMDINHVLTNANGQKFVMAAPADGDLSAKWILDIRSAADFGTAHIEGANNVAFSDILTAAATADKPIIVVCYTGQTACYATSLLRLYGYEDTQALKWGMSGWNTTFDKWTANCKDLTTSSNWNTTINASASFSAPEWSSSTTDGASLLKERVEAAVKAGFKTATGADVLGNTSGFYVNNYFSDAHYTGFGHVNGAVRVNPLLIDDCDNLDQSNPVVTYCYTGQTSAVVTAYLNVLGFDAKSLLFGINGMSHSNVFWTAGDGVTNHWGHDSNPKDLSTVSN
ncbi:MAG: hypothetical protein GQ525_11135 [Draconibacterium sp.]|nr:hypothetical protein [Draconibacterium sp.]